MSLTRVLPKQQLLEEITRFIKDPNRGISVKLFAELCGYEDVSLYNVFIHREYPMTETMQIRVNKAYADWKAGRVRVMKRPDNTRYVDYRREPAPVFRPHMGLKLTSEGIKMDIGVRNRHDYGQKTLKDHLGG